MFLVTIALMPTARCKQCSNTFEYPSGTGKWTACCSDECREQRRLRQAELARQDWPTCSVQECTAKVRSGRATMCDKHYFRVRRNGTLKLTNPQRAQRGVCIIDGCTKPDVGRHGYCNKHYSRKIRNGDPELLLGGPTPKRGPDNGMWRGDQIGYGAAHDRVKRIHGSASQHKCADCPAQAAHWSYNHDDPDELRAPQGAYSHKADHYSPRCVPCHKRFDLERVGGTAKLDLSA